MAYEDFFKTFSAEVASAGLGTEFHKGWLDALEAALPQAGGVLSVPEYAFFATALQYHAEHLGNQAAFQGFIADVAAKVHWVKQKARGPALAKKLSQNSPDGPIGALLEIYTAWKLEHDAAATINQLEPLLPNGKNKLDAEVHAGGSDFLVECFASLGSGLAESGALDGYWSPQADLVVAKIRNKILDKASQASSAALPVVLFIAPSADFLMPPDKIPSAVDLAYSDPRTACISVVAFTGGSHTYLFENVADYFENPNATIPIGLGTKAALDSLKLK